MEQRAIKGELAHLYGDCRDPTKRSGVGCTKAKQSRVREREGVGMARKGLKYEDIIMAAVALVEEKGFSNFSLRELAGKLGVQPSSLYNHVGGIQELNMAVGLYGIEQMEHMLMSAIEGRSMAEALLAMATAYRSFARSNPELYEALIELRMNADPNMRAALLRIVKPFFIVFRKEIQDESLVLHLQRSFRSMLHGMVALENTGHMTCSDVDSEESFYFMVNQFIEMVKRGNFNGCQ